MIAGIRSSSLASGPSKLGTKKKQKLSSGLNLIEKAKVSTTLYTHTLKTQVRANRKVVWYNIREPKELQWNIK